MAKSGDIKGETENTILAAQDQAVSRNYFKIKIQGKKLRVNGGYVNNMKKLLTLMFIDLCIIVKFIQKNSTR